MIAVLQCLGRPTMIAVAKGLHWWNPLCQLTRTTRTTTRTTTGTTTGTRGTATTGTSTVVL